jgi:hypothetical protein
MGLLDYLESIGETGAMLGTGAVSSMVGMPYGVYKGITSGKYGTPEANRIAEDEARRFIERNTYQPRTEGAQNAMQYLGGLLSDAKIPPILPEAAALSAIPMRQSMARMAENAAIPSQFGSQTGAVKIGKKDATVMRPQRIAYPNIYQNPKELVAEAASRVAPEDPLLNQLFGVTREDLWNISQQGQRQGNITDRPFKAAKNATGAEHATEVMNPKNTKRITDIIGEAQQQPDLYKGMASWYTMDPLFQRFADIYGPEQAITEYNKFNTLTGMSSPGSEVLTELNRGSAAYMMDKAGRFQDFKKYGGLPVYKRKSDFPPELEAIMGHPYHKTAQAGPMEKYLSGGLLDMKSAKVPSYIAASGVPETGFQTQWPVGDAHWSRIVGLPDVRGATTKKGKASVPNASASVPEMVSLGPWWQNQIAAPMGLEPVPAQAVIWGAGSGATGVTSPIGAGKLELLSQQIGKTARRLNVSPETARDMIIRGQTHAGYIDPQLAALLGAGAGGLLAYDSMNNE